MGIPAQPLKPATYANGQQGGLIPLRKPPVAAGSLEYSQIPSTVPQSAKRLPISSFFRPIMDLFSTNEQSPIPELALPMHSEPLKYSRKGQDAQLADGLQSMPFVLDLELPPTITALYPDLGLKHVFAIREENLMDMLKVAASGRTMSCTLEGSKSPDGAMVLGGAIPELPSILASAFNMIEKQNGKKRLPVLLKLARSENGLGISFIFFANGMAAPFTGHYQELKEQIAQSSRHPALLESSIGVQALSGWQPEYGKLLLMLTLAFPSFSPKLWEMPANEVLEAFPQRVLSQSGYKAQDGSQALAIGALEAPTILNQTE